MGFIYRPDLGAKELRERVVNALGAAGYHICRVAAHSHETGRDTGNQENAYGFGIYLDGDLIDWRRCAENEPATEPNGGLWGHEQVERFFREYHPSLAGYTLVIVNAMWYSALQEEGNVAPRSKDLKSKSGKTKAAKGKVMYRVISQTYGMMKTELEKLARDLNFDKGWSKKATIWHWTRQSDI